MLRLTRRPIAAIAIAILLGGFQSAPVALPPDVTVLMDDPEAALAFDYYALTSAGHDLRAVSEAFTKAVARRAGTDENGLGGRCMTEAETAVRAGLEAAQLAANQAAFEADKISASGALTKWSEFSDRVLARDGPAEQPFVSVARWIEQAETAGPRERELFSRVAQDQLLRHAFSAGRLAWGETLSPGALARVHTVLGQRICGIDGENTAWLKSDIMAHGWYRLSISGSSASSAAWLLTQHADRSPDFQKEVLAILEPLVAENETSASNYAYLHDRVSVNTGQPQRYGTQGRCVAKDIWEPNELQDAERVQAFRDALELGSLAEYTAHMHRYCADFTG